MRLRRLAASVSTFVALASAASTAAAGDVQACLAASEKGQKARAAGKLREAREQFLVCGTESCPTIVRRDCAQWTSELTNALPTVVFGAKDKAGRDLFDVRVFVDGERLIDKLDGKAVFIDPGPHTFRFETAGAAPVTEKALIKEGEKTRVLAATFELGESDSAPAPPSDKGSDAITTEGGGRGVLPWVVVGIGAAGVATGVVLVATAPSRPANCNVDTKTCTRVPGESDAQFRDEQDRAGKADSQPVLGWAVAGIGAAFVAGGLLWHFLEPTGASSTSAKASRPRVLPWTTATAGGVSIGGAF